MNSIFSYEDYKLFVSEFLYNMPKHGHGELRKIAQVIGISTVLTSQIFNGDRDLSLEQAYNMTKYLQLTDLEKRYFLLLVQYARAGIHEYKSYLKTQMKQVQKISKELKQRIKADKELTDYEKSIYYSDWSYAAVRLASDLPTCNTIYEISARLGLTVEKTKLILEFLIKNNFCKEVAGKITIGSGRLHLEADSPLILNRQISWRLKSLEKMDSNDPLNLYYTSPMSISIKALERLREDIIRLIKSSAQYIGPSQPEELIGFNIDLFRI